jgi:hypothetical protein
MIPNTSDTILKSEVLEKSHLEIRSSRCFLKLLRYLMIPTIPLWILWVLCVFIVGIIRHRKGLYKHLDDPMPNGDFPGLHFFGIVSLVFDFISDHIIKQPAEKLRMPNQGSLTEGEGSVH